MNGKSDAEIIQQATEALREIVTLSYITYSMGRFIKTDALITAAEFLQNSLEERCPEELTEKIQELKAKKDSNKDTQDWII